ncbi:hypothetical protein FSP39_016623 [Pinctada imbricata]|uniref:PWWP domain-containing protein n=1 Tax=Pinctada imbricata TaxID=66713 RepID=A0AA88YPN1_PINIB|nr:hypothetical protein FSP39_016623 [Pinctada imbricata]
MNTDPVHNTCESVEEDYQAYDRLAKRLGYKYVMSHLTEGTVVWAKMTGYCRWPAIISKDPSCDLYYMVDNEGHPSRYHVEYLGKQHSHAWIPSKLIDLYGHRAEKDNYTQKQYNKKDSKGNSKKKGKKKKRICLKAELGYKKLSVYKRSPVEAAVEEAESLLPLSPRKRLMKCTFQPKSNNTPISKSSSTSGGDIVYSYMNQQYARNTGQNSQGQKKLENTVPLKLCKKDPTVFEFKDCKLTPNKFENKTCKLGKITNLEIQRTVEKPEVCGELTKFECSHMEMKNTLVNKSKEERFKIDIEMYKRNEKAFDHDLFRFMERNGMKIKKRPVWHNTPIGLFQLFLAVYERGGYQQVIKFLSI